MKKKTEWHKITKVITPTNPSMPMHIAALDGIIEAFSEMPDDVYNGATTSAGGHIIQVDYDDKKIIVTTDYLRDETPEEKTNRIQKRKKELEDDLARTELFITMAKSEYAKILAEENEE
jgi:hypothetical protein